MHFYSSCFMQWQLLACAQLNDASLLCMRATCLITQIAFFLLIITQGQAEDFAQQLTQQRLQAAASGQPV